MCGFLLEVAHKDSSRKLSEFQSASKHIRVRGPDQINYSVLQNQDLLVYACHALLDISGQSISQPIIDAGTSSSLLLCLFNGELYDFHQQGTPDSLSVASLFINNQLDASLDGEYAIAVYDATLQTLNIFTDEFMTKPLFYAVSNENKSIAVSSYKSALIQLGYSLVNECKPHQSVVLDATIPKVSTTERTPYFSLDTNSPTTLERASSCFLQSIYKRCLSTGDKPVFVPLSSGYDSGAICCALNLLDIPYHTFTVRGNENDAVINHRIDINRRASCLSHTDLKGLRSSSFHKRRTLLEDTCEHFEYSHTSMSLYSDNGAIGLSIIAEEAMSKGLKVCLSGCGADELFSDYGFNGTKYFEHSEFGGLFPERLSGFFPWKKVYGDTMRDYLMKEEYILGAYGLEGRYPFLDLSLVQSFLDLPSKSKNMHYKSFIYDLLVQNDYPIEVNQKRGFSTYRKYDLQTRILDKCDAIASELRRYTHKEPLP